MNEGYEFPNAYFKISDPSVETIAGFDIPDGWWSRSREYRFAMEYAGPGMIVADMGCGWHYRPLHDWLAGTCAFVYGVDSHPGILDLPDMPKGAFIVADFSQEIPMIDPASLDRIFCISVLEELIDYGQALAEFRRLLKPDGRIVITMDAPYDPDKPAHEKYTGVNLFEFETAMAQAGLVYDGDLDRIIPENALFNVDFNLCVWHCILKHAPENYE